MCGFRSTVASLSAATSTQDDKLREAASEQLIRSTNEEMLLVQPQVNSSTFNFKYSRNDQQIQTSASVSKQMAYARTICYRKNK